MTYSIAFADVDGDGDMDMVAGNESQTNKLYLNDGSGGFSSIGTSIGSETDRTYSIAFADVDGDGDMDMVTGNKTQTNKLYLNNGSGGFSSPGVAIVGSESDFTSSIAFADVDGDGDMDMVAGNHAQNNKLYLNDGSGGFPLAGVAIVGSESDFTASIAFADVDGDGDMDLVAANYGQTNKLYLNDGSGSFPLIGTAIGRDIDFTVDITLTDVDGDGDVDMVLGNEGQTNKLYLNDGSGGFESIGTAIGSEADRTNSIAFADVDGDGDIDMVAGNVGKSNKLYLNDGSDGFALTGTAIGSETNNTFSFAFADVDGDGDMDLVAGNSSQSNKLYLNNGSGGFPLTGSAIGSETDSTTSIAFADVDGDGDIDVVAGNDGETNQLYLNDGSGGFSATGTAIGSETDDTKHIVFADVDGDGDIDLVAGNQNQTNKLYLNDGSGGFASTGTAIGSETDRTNSIAFADVDGDGDMDVVAGNQYQSNKLYLNDGSGGFSSIGAAIGGETDDTRSIAIADVDGDGDMDVVAGNSSQSNKLYLNDGRGGFAAPGAAIGSETDSTLSIAFADVDGDGDIDVVAGNYSQSNKLYLNDGSGGFSATGTAIGSETDDTKHIVFADVDGDGDIDLVAGNQNQTNKLYLNDGSGGFASTGTAIGSETDRTNSIAFADVDGDGDMDLVAGNYSQSNKLYLNDGSGSFSSIGTAIGSETDNTSSIAFADVDGDGDMDMVAGNNLQTNKLYLNDGSGSFSSVGTAIGSETDDTWSIAFADVDGDGDVDMVAGNVSHSNKVHLNNGSGGFASIGTSIGIETDRTYSIAFADVDSDGDMDMVAGNFNQPNKLYLNDGSGGFSSIGMAISSERDITFSIAFADADGDGDMDVVAGNFGLNKLYLNDGSGGFSSIGTAIGGETDSTRSIAFADVDGDGDMDVVAGSFGLNKLYLNNGSQGFAATGTAIGSETDTTYSIAFADVDGDGDVDMVVGNDGQTNKRYKRQAFITHLGVLTSTKVNGSLTNIDSARIVTTSTVNTPTTRNTSIDYYLTNNGGSKWYKVKENDYFTFPTTGTDDIRWKATLQSLSSVRSPVLNQLTVTTNSAGSVTIDDITPMQGQTLTATVTDADRVSGTVIYQWHSNGANVGSNSATFTTTQSDVGKNITVTATYTDDGGLAEVTSSLATSAVTNINDAPVITGTPSTSVAQDSAYSFTPTVTDVDSGDTTTFSITNKPTWATFSISTGQLSGTPTNDDVGTTSGIVITVSDSANLSDSLAAFTLSVTNINDAPVITGTPSTSVAQDSAYSFTPTVTDVDSGDTTTFSITNKPTWATFSISTGQLSGTPTNDDVGTTSGIVITVSDSANLSDSLAAFTLSVTNINDAPVAVNDSFALSFSDTNTYALDVLANDTDIDEEALMISSAKASVGSVSVLDGMLMYRAQGNTQGEIALSYRITDAAGASDQADVLLNLSQNDSAPVINLPADIDALATGLFTKVDLGVATAEDSEGNTLAVSIVNNTQRFAPGKHVIFWRTVDGAGQETVASQKVNIQPLVSLSKDAIVGEESTSAFTVFLNGPAPAYPVVVAYDVGGSADGNDHDVISGEVMINAGTQASVTFNVFGDGQVEGNEEIIITLTGDINVGAKNSTTITIVEDNVAPTIRTQVRQDDDVRSLVTRGGRDVVITAATTDVNLLDNVSVAWSSVNDNLVNISNVDNEFVFATADLASGIYKIIVTASDDASPSLSTRQDVYVEVVDTLATLTSRDSDGDLIPDNVEGFNDSDKDGIPDYLDNISECNVLPAQVASGAEFLVEGDPGVCLRIGATVAQNQSGGAEIFTNEVSGDSAALNMGGLFDFIATGLPKAGDSYRITLPQRLPIPSGAIYRKLVNDEWVDFVVDDNNAIYSAPGNAGFCPPPGVEEWTTGLNEGDWCVLLEIEDGGPNDDDGAANRSIVDPGGVAVLLSDNDLPQVNSDSAVVGVGQTVTVDVLANDTDANDDPLTISAASVDFGNVLIDDNQLTYTPPMGFVGAATIIYSVTDGQGGTGANTLMVNVLLNIAPTVNDDSASTDDRTPININVLANDSDVDGDTLTVISVSASQGRVNINPDGSVLYTPLTGFEGTDVITYEVTDGKQGISTGQVRVTVVAFKAATIEEESSGGSMGGVWLLLLSFIALGPRYLGTLPANAMSKSPSPCQ